VSFYGSSDGLTITRKLHQRILDVEAGFCINARNKCPEILERGPGLALGMTEYQSEPYHMCLFEAAA
jgi:hypothetical protein